MQINRTHEEIREVQDAFLLLDAIHYGAGRWRPCSAARWAWATRMKALALRGRFGEIWSASYPAVSSTTVGL